MVVIGILLASAIAAGALYQFIGAARDARTCAPPGTMVDVGGRRLHLTSVGSGTPTVVFESGIAASSLSWSRVLPEVAKFTRACAYDRAGLAWSDLPQHPRTTARMVDDLRRLLERAAIAAPHVLVGHSFGAFLVCAYASQHPDTVAGLVLLDPPTEWQHATPERSRLLRGGVQLSRVGGILARLGVVRACLTLVSGGAPSVPRTVVRIFGPTAARTVERLVGEVRKLPPEVHPMVRALWCQPKCFRAMRNCRLCGGVDVAAGRPACDHLERRSIATDDRAAPTPGAALDTESPRRCGAERALDSVRRAGCGRHGGSRHHRQNAQDERGIAAECDRGPQDAAS